jgi:hydrogenase expression/formation protein HypE
MLKVGKLDSDLLEQIVFKKITFKRPEVLTRPGIGEDCAVVDFGTYECVMSTDPITAAVGDIGRLAVHISCNDIASNGVEPLGIMLTVMMPEGTTTEDIEEIMTQAANTSEELGVEIIGGHTEITSAVVKPIIVSTAIGRSEKWASKQREAMKPGDFILLTKAAGLEGTAIIARDFEEDLKGILTGEELVYAKSLMDKVSVVKEGIIAGKIGTSGMHDITEGGILGAAWEMCRRGNVGAELWVDQIPVEEVTRKICEQYDVDYLRLISSGSMVIMTGPNNKEAMLCALKDAGVQATCIGVIKNPGDGIKMIVGDEAIEIAPPAADELYKVVG